MKTWEDIEKIKDVAYGIEVRKRRDDMKITQKKLAKRIGIKQSALSNYELGMKRCPEPVRTRIEKVLGPIEFEADSGEQQELDLTGIEEAVAENPLAPEIESDTGNAPVSESESHDGTPELKSWMNGVMQEHHLSASDLAAVMSVTSSLIMTVVKGNEYLLSDKNKRKLIDKLNNLELLSQKGRSVCKTDSDIRIQDNLKHRIEQQESLLKKGTSRKDIAFAASLRQFRTDANLTTRQAALILGTSPGQISQYERMLIKPIQKTRRSLEQKIAYLRANYRMEDIGTKILDIIAEMNPVNEDVLHEEFAAACDPEPVFEDSSTPLPTEEPQDAPAAGSGKDHISSWLERVNILYKAGLDDLGDDDFRTVCGIIRGLRYSGQN